MLCIPNILDSREWVEKLRRFLRPFCVIKSKKGKKSSLLCFKDKVYQHILNVPIIKILGSP